MSFLESLLQTRGVCILTDTLLLAAKDSPPVSKLTGPIPLLPVSSPLPDIRIKNIQRSASIPCKQVSPPASISSTNMKAMPPCTIVDHELRFTCHGWHLRASIHLHDASNSLTRKVAGKIWHFTNPLHTRTSAFTSAPPLHLLQSSDFRPVDFWMVEFVYSKLMPSLALDLPVFSCSKGVLIYDMHA